MFFEHDKGKTHSSGKLLYSARVIPYRGSWLDFEFDPKDLVYVRIDRGGSSRPPCSCGRWNARKGTSGFPRFKDNGEILDVFFKTDRFELSARQARVLLVPDRWRGETAPFDLADRDGNVIVEGRAAGELPSRRAPQGGAGRPASGRWRCPTNTPPGRCSPATW